MIKDLLLSKRFGLLVVTVLAYLIANPDQIASIGITPKWQTIIVAAAAFGTKIIDAMKTPAAA